MKSWETQFANFPSLLGFFSIVTKCPYLYWKVLLHKLNDAYGGGPCGGGPCGGRPPQVYYISSITTTH